MIESVRVTVGDGALREHGREAVTTGVEQVGFSGDVEKGLLLARETAGGEILGSRGAAHSYVNRVSSDLCAESGVSIRNRDAELGWEFCARRGHGWSCSLSPRKLSRF